MLALDCCPWKAEAAYAQTKRKNAKQERSHGETSYNSNLCVACICECLAALRLVKILTGRRHFQNPVRAARLHLGSRIRTLQRC